MTVRVDVDPFGDTGIRLVVLQEEDVLWPHPRSGDGSSVFEAEDVLSFLADSWPSLLLNERWPDIFDVRQEPRSMTGLLRAAEEKWAMAPAEEDEENAEIEAFLYRHDLSSMKHGAGLAPFYVLRQGTHMCVETHGRMLTEWRFGEFVEHMEQVGRIARTQLAKHGPAYRATIDRWDLRDRPDPVAFGALITGQRKSEVQDSAEIRDSLLLPLAGLTLAEVANDNGSPLLAVARSSGRLGPRGIAETIAAYRRLPHGNVAGVAMLRRLIVAVTREVRSPLDQGIRAAEALRDRLSLSDDCAVDLSRICAEHGIAVRREILDARLSGLASAGPMHGPAILLNEATERRGPSLDDLERSLRFTWAHELGHLMLDDDEWPALADAVQQRVPKWIETRANAFSAYLLLPERVAYRMFDQSAPRQVWAEVEQALNAICNVYGVTRIVASRQVERGAPLERRRHLRSFFQAHVPNF